MKHFREAARRHPAARLALLMFLSSTSSLAIAGRDAGQIEMQDKANKAAAQSAADQETAIRLKAQQFLPLDHGPHAVATAWTNRRVVELRIEAERHSYASAMASKE